MLERGIPFPVIAEVMGWSPATTIRMAKRYGHIGRRSLRDAVNAISRVAKKEKRKSKKEAQTRLVSFDNPFDLGESENLARVN
jgi:hypothetical protein